MKVWAYVALVTIATGFLTWGYYAVYNAGADSEALACSVEREKTLQEHTVELNSVLERERNANKAADNIARVFHSTVLDEVEKNAKLQKQLSQQKTIGECVKDDAGNDIAYLSNESIRVLNGCSEARGLPGATEKQGFVTEDKVTASHLAEYTCYAIGRYNRCAEEVNAAIKEQE